MGTNLNPCACEHDLLFLQRLVFTRASCSHTAATSPPEASIELISLSGTRFQVARRIWAAAVFPELAERMATLRVRMHAQNRLSARSWQVGCCRVFSGMMRTRTRVCTTLLCCTSLLTQSWGQIMGHSPSNLCFESCALSMCTFPARLQIICPWCGTGSQLWDIRPTDRAILRCTLFTCTSPACQQISCLWIGTESRLSDIRPSGCTFRGVLPSCAPLHSLSRLAIYANSTRPA